MFHAHLHTKIEELNSQLEKEREINEGRAGKNIELQLEMERLRNRRDDELHDLKYKLQHLEDKAAINKEQALQELARKMSETLIKSDITRESALAKLAVYEKMDTKADANTIKEMATKLIEVVGIIGKPQVNVNTAAAK